MDAFNTLIDIESLLINSGRPNIQTAKQLVKTVEPHLSPIEKPLFNILESHLDALAIETTNRTVITLALAVISQAQVLLITKRL